MFKTLALAIAALATPAMAQEVSTSPPDFTAALQAVQATIPTPGTGSPTAVVDSNTGSAGAAGMYAPFMHTHPSKARKGRVLVPATGFTDVTFSAAFTTGSPLCSVTAETTSGDTNVVNAQIDGQPTMTGMRIRITRTAITVASLLGLSILSVPTQQATYAHFICIEP